MSFIEHINSQPKADVIFQQFTQRVEFAVDRRAAWLSAREKLQPAIAAFEKIGCDIRVDGGLDIHVALAGDKEAFIKAWKIWRELGVRLDPPQKGATSLNQFCTVDGVVFWYQFSSTVCKRVKVGTKLQEVEVYETQCGTDLSQAALEVEPQKTYTGNQSCLSI